MTVAGGALLAVMVGLAYAAQMSRWLRVLQREHYDPRSMLRFLGRWSAPPLASAKAPSKRRERRSFTLSHVLVVALLGAIVVRANVVIVLVSVVYGLLCPFGLSIRGRTSSLRWTRRLALVAVVSFALALVVTVLGAQSRDPFLGAVVVIWAVPPVLDLATRILAPLEERRARRYVDQARRRLERVHPRVVAITGSYGKTSTKTYLAQILERDGGVVASPHSYNNRAGLSRALNENLRDDTRIFIAEMGTYGPGEIRDLTSWCTPEIAVVTAIGPVHLERMGTLDVVEEAKREITERAATVVLNVDDERLARWPDSLRQRGLRVMTAGTSDACDVRVAVEGRRWCLSIDGHRLVEMDAVVGVHVTNLACAMAAARALGIEPADIAARAGSVAPAASRLNVATAASGVVVIDDTFNANPASARAALDVLTALPLTGRRVVVTPGMVELGVEQYRENVRLAQRVEASSAELIVVARTNARALASGFGRPVTRFDTRPDAVRWVRSRLGPGDGVLYLNDLPDHYP